MKKYDYLIVGAGLSGAMFAYKARREAKTCLVVEKSPHVGGHCYTKTIEGIDVHMFGAHIFRTSSKKVWDFVNDICPFMPYVNSPLADHQGRLYNLPFNMNTFNAFWGARTPEEAKVCIGRTVVPCERPNNVEDYAKASIGTELYEAFIRCYTEKQWGRSCRELSPETIGRLPVRFVFDNNYYNEVYQGIPAEGYTKFIESLLAGTEVRCNTNFISARDELMAECEHIVFTGRIDEYFDYKYGILDYRCVRFEHMWLPEIDNYQGNAVINFVDKDVPYTRLIEHKHFARWRNVPGTIITYEYPASQNEEAEPSYPVLSRANLNLYEKYKAEAAKDRRVTFLGRLAEYRYYSMDQIIEKLL